MEKNKRNHCCVVFECLCACVWTITKNVREVFVLFSLVFVDFLNMKNLRWFSIVALSSPSVSSSVRFVLIFFFCLRHRRIVLFSQLFRRFPFIISWLLILAKRVLDLNKRSRYWSCTEFPIWGFLKLVDATTYSRAEREKLCENENRWTHIHAYTLTFQCQWWKLIYRLTVLLNFNLIYEKKKKKEK